MLYRRLAVAFVLGVMLSTAVSTTLSACFVDPNPPYPHGDAGWSDDFLTADGGDGGEAGQ